MITRQMEEIGEIITGSIDQLNEGDEPQLVT
jgi:hypothetical protein